MGKGVIGLLAFNRGIADTRALVRTDLERMRFAAETQDNFIPRTLGAMSLRPGFEYQGTTRSNVYSRHIPFIFGISDLTTDVARIDLANSGFARFWVNDALISRASVSAAITNDTFDSDISNWTDNDESGAASAWVTGGYAGLTGTGSNAAILDTGAVTVTETGTEHALRVTIQRGPVTIRVGTSEGDDSYISERSLATGVYSLAFTPTGDFHVRIMNAGNFQSQVSGVEVESSGTVEIATPWGSTALIDSVRYAQERDVVFCASTVQMRRIERHAADSRSWGIALYETDDGPFRPINLGSTTLVPTATTGDTTLTASRALFESTHVGALFKIFAGGQIQTASLGGAGQATDGIRVAGLDAGGGRNFQVDISGTWNATVTLQYSLNDESSYVDSGTTYTSNQSATIFTADNDDNVIKFWRLIIDTGDYTSGTAVCTLTYAGGGQTGLARVTAVTNATTASIRVLQAFGSTAVSADWYESEWSDFRGWPTAVGLYESRLYFGGRGKIWGSIVDAYHSFDDDETGDDGMIRRSIAAGPGETVNWILPLQRLMAGTAGAEMVIKADSFDSPLTPATTTLRDASTQGSAEVAAAKMDNAGFFVSRSGKRVYELAYNIDVNNYVAQDLMQLVPDIGGDGISRIVVQRQPDTRVHMVRDDGTVVMLIVDLVEKVRAFVRIETDGVIEDACVLPGTAEDQVYYIVKRTIDGNTVRYIEKWALESECIGGNTSYALDSFLTFSSNGSATVTGLSHLEGETVYCWADGADQGTAVVASGSAEFGASVDDGAVGLTYDADYKSRKLVDVSDPGAGSLTQPKGIGGVGFVLENTHHKGLRYGADFTTMYDLPQTVRGTTVVDDTVHSTFEEPMSGFDFRSDPNARLCLRASAPKPCTVVAAMILAEEHAKR